MSFRLTSTGKIILSERLILDEASVDYDKIIAQCMTLQDHIREQIKEVMDQGGNNGENSKVLQQYLDRTNKLLQEIQNSANTIHKVKDPAVVKSRVKVYIDDIDSLLATLNTANVPADYNKVKDIFDDIKEKTTNSDFTEKLVKELKVQVEKLAQALKTVISNGITVKSDDGDLSQGDYVNTLENIHKDIIKLKAMADKHESSIDAAVEQQIVDLLSTTSKDRKAEFIAMCKKAHEGHLGQVVAASKTEPYSGDVDEIADTKKGIDWAKKYAASKNKKSFWDLYFATYWKQDARKIEALGDAYKQECEVMGFKEETNPFIKFLQYTVVTKKFNITKGAYNAIHDSVAASNGSVTKKDLESQNPDTLHPIFCKDFYTKAYGDAREYLKRFGQIKAQNGASITANIMSIEAMDEDKRTENQAFLLKISKYLHESSKPVNDSSDDNKIDLGYLTWVILYEIPATTFSTMSDSEKTSSIVAQQIENIKLRNITDIDSILTALNISVTKATSAKP